MEEELDKDDVRHRFYLTYTASTSPGNSRRFWRLQSKRKSNSHLQYSYDLVLMAKEGKVLQGIIIHSLIEIGKRPRM
jgi:hypothetical protein